VYLSKAEEWTLGGLLPVWALDSPPSRPNGRKAGLSLPIAFADTAGDCRQTLRD